MAVDKRIPRVLNSDADSKTIDKVSMKDALNLYSGPDNEGFQGDSKSDSGDQVLKNIKGNTEVFVHEGEGLPVDARVIGSVEDVKTDITYFFVYSANAENQGVWAYDKNDILNTFDGGAQAGPSVRLIYKSAQFNFPQNGFVKADIVYTNASKTLESLGVEFDKDVLIYFTDGINEPRKLNAYRAFVESSGSNIYGDDSYAEADFICACPRVPLDPITFSWDFPDETRSVSNFSTTGGFKFAYQYIYKDGTESAISPYSDVAFPPSVLSQGSQTYVDHSQYNRLLLYVPSSNAAEVSYIRLMAQEGAIGSFGIIDEIEDLNIAEFQEYYFYNDRISKGVSSSEVNKQFDSVPRSSVAQAVSSNRLMYGNYLDGFDNVDTNATVEAVYRERGEEFKTFDIKVQPSIAPLSEQLGEEYSNAKTVGFVLDCSNLPDQINEGTSISFNLTIKPDNNWHLYEYKNGESYHQSKSLGPQDQQAPSTSFDGANTNTGFNQTPEQAGKNFLDENGGTMFGGNTSLSLNTTWSVKDLPANPVVDINEPLLQQQNISCSYGTSAGNPLIIQGGALTFKANITANAQIQTGGAEAVAQALEWCMVIQGPQLIGNLASVNFELTDGFDGIVSKPSYEFDLGLQSGQLISSPFLSDPGDDNPYRDLIVAVKRTDSLSIAGYTAPCGYFIVNKAKPTFYCESVDSGPLSFSGAKRHIRIGLLDVVDIEVLTCVHDIPESLNPFTLQSEDAAALSWILIDQADAEAIGDGTTTLSQWLSDNNIYNVNLNEAEYQAFNNQPVPSLITSYFHPRIGFVLANFLNQVGFLNFQEQSFFNGLEVLGQGEVPLIRHCLMDGEGGVGGGLSRGGGGNEYDDLFFHHQGSVVVNPFPYQWSGAGNNNYVYTGSMFLTGTLVYAFESQNQAKPTYLPLLLAEYTSGAEGFDSVYPDANPDNTGQLEGGSISATSVNYNLLQSYAEISVLNTIVSDGVEQYDRSFKTEANHDFGIVYYDQRGRHGFVNHLDTVFIDGYNSTERGGNLQGPAHVRITLDHDPPSWAHHYKIVYSGNSTVRDFVQYTAGGAFIKQSNQEISSSNSNIYVSLNYLQGHPVSYVSSFGARTPEGGLNFYKFEPGDKMRLISYGPPDNRVYPPGFEFDVVDLVKLGDEDNPLVSGSAETVPENKKGDFVVLKNNPTAYGFTFGDVSSNTSFWDQNVVFELRTPEKDRNIDELVYYEIGDTYDVVFQDGALVHEQEVIEINKGDVWFRPVATNVRVYENGQFTDIIGDIDGIDDDISDSNFVTVLMETKTASDLFRSDNSFLGRPNVIFKDAAETVREATITYSEPTNPEGRKVNYSSFNASLANFKDLSEHYGSIEYMTNHNDYVVAIQKEKVSIVPVNKNILSDASGNQQIIASLNVLGEVFAYPGASGCDDDPSSVYDSGDEIYFCNKSFSKVYRWTKSGGVEEISDKGMSSVIRASLKRAMSNGQVRVVGGFDPLKDEYLLSIQNPPVRSSVDVIEVVQPTRDAVVDPGTEGPSGEEGTDETGGGGLTETEEGANLEVIPDVLTFANVEIGQTANNLVVLRTTTDNPINIESISFTDPRFSINPLQAFPIVLIPEFGFTNIPVSVSFTPDSTEMISAEMEFTTNDPNQPSVIIDVEGNGVEETSTATGTASTAAAAFAEAYNDFYLTNLSPEDMSAQLAIDYLKDLKNAPEADQPKFAELYELLSISNRVKTRRFLSDTLGAISSGGTLSGAAELDGSIGAPELTAFLGTWQTSYDTTSSIFSEETSDPNPATLPPPSTSELPPEFNNIQEAVNYLIAAGNMTAYDFHFFFNNVNLADQRHLVNFNQTGTITITDFLEALSAFGQSYQGSDLAFGSNYPGPTIEEPEYSAFSVLLYIQQQVSLGATMTVEQFYQIAQYVKDPIRMNMNAIQELVIGGGTGASDDFTWTAGVDDLLVLLSFFDQGGATADFQWNLSDSIF